MFRTRKVQSGTVKVTHETEMGDLKLEIVVEDGKVKDVEIDMTAIPVEFMQGEDEIYNAVIAACIPRLINEGVL